MSKVVGIKLTDADHARWKELAGEVPLTLMVRAAVDAYALQVAGVGIGEVLKPTPLQEAKMIIEGQKQTRGEPMPQVKPLTRAVKPEPKFIPFTKAQQTGRKK